MEMMGGEIKFLLVYNWMLIEVDCVLENILFECICMLEDNLLVVCYSVIVNYINGDWCFFV